MKRILLALALVIPLAGCASIQRLEYGYQQATTATIPANTVAIARNGFNILEATATNYLNLTRCDKTASKVCRDENVTAILGPALLNARKARNNLVAFQKQYPGQLGSSGLYDALVLSVTTLQGIIATYHIRS